MGCSTSVELDELYTNEANSLLGRTMDEENEIKIEYVLIFSVGSRTTMIKPTSQELEMGSYEDDNNEEWMEGMDQMKMYGQIFNNCWTTLEDVNGASVEAYGSSDSKFMYLAFSDIKLPSKDAQIFRHIKNGDYQMIQQGNGDQSQRLTEVDLNKIIKIRNCPIQSIVIADNKKIPVIYSKHDNGDNFGLVRFDPNKEFIDVQTLPRI